MPGDRKRLVLLLSVGAVALALIGGGLIGAYTVLSKRAEGDAGTLAGTMTEWVPEEAIVERLALLTLAGWTDQAVIERCLTEGETDTALSVLSHSVTLEDRTRAGLLLRLASLYAAGERPDLAGGILNKVGVIAMLSPSFSDVTRIELLVQAATGLIRIEQEDAAIEMLDGAGELVRLSSELKPAQRQNQARVILDAYEAAGKDASESVLAQPGALTAQPRRLAPPSHQSEAAAEKDVIPESYGNVTTARQEAAIALAQYLEERPGEWPVGLVAGLADVLKAEDALVMELDQIDLEIQWLAKKREIAGGKMGGSLVPEWETQSAEIDGMLREVWMRHTGTTQDSLGVDAQKAELLAGELGLIPEYDIAAGATRLQEAFGTLKGTGLDWVLNVSIDGDSIRYSILSQ